MEKAAVAIRENRMKEIISRTLVSNLKNAMLPLANSVRVLTQPSITIEARAHGLFKSEITTPPMSHFAHVNDSPIATLRTYFPLLSMVGPGEKGTAGE